MGRISVKRYKAILRSKVVYKRFLHFPAKSLANLKPNCYNHSVKHGDEKRVGLLQFGSFSRKSGSEEPHRRKGQF
nr:MAG TPA: hypothetical protein [Caudoviricetes sp.]